MAFDPVGNTIDKTEQSGEKFVDHADTKLWAHVANLLPTLEGYELVIRVSLDKKT